MPFYQDYDAGIGLKKRLEEMKCHSIWGDGIFTEYYQLHGGSKKSTDGLREAIQKSKYAKLIDCGKCYVQDKWNALLQEAGKEYDVAFLFGCDEIPKGNFQKCAESVPVTKHPMVYRIHMEEKGDNSGERFKDHSGPKERVFWKPGDIEVRELHWAFFDRTVKDSYPLVSTKEALPHLMFYHDNTRRPKERDKMMQEYQKKRVPGEYRRSRQVIRQVYETEHLTPDILRKLYPDAYKIETVTRYNGTKAFKLFGSDDLEPLDGYCSYVKMPFNGDTKGLYITKSRIDIKADHQK